MKVILSDYVQSLGSAGEEVNVAPGYARNFLIPRGLAFEATEASRKTFNNNLKQRARKLARAISDAESLKGVLEGMEPLVFTRASGEDGKLFGSVTSADIVEALKGRGHEFDKRKVELDRPIKTLGDHEVTLHIHGKVNARLEISVHAEAAPEQAGAQETAGQDEAPEENG
ncbi:MAG: 50S ribosomal protein L9 [Nitrospinae bacterium]|nr:50S ribosomal protein L9 [Nitrospinota bacterium]